MKLTQLELAQVRGFEQAVFPFQPDMNLLVGINGAGKSTVLDVLRILLSEIIPNFSSSRPKPEVFKKNDIRVGRGALTAELDFTIDGDSYHYLVHIPREDYVIDQSREGQVREQTYDLEARRDMNPTADPAMRTRNGSLAVYFSTRRSVYNLAKSTKASTAHGPAAAFAEALEPRQLRLKEFAEWWLVQHALAQESLFSTFGRDMEVLSDTVSFFLDGCSNLRAVKEPDVTLLVDKADGVLDVRQLSDGERNLLAMVLDLARRLAIIEPTDPLKNGSAVVLIDELDLHLHPSWQRDIVGKLTRTFPNCQFIATTHSPQILGEVPPEQILLIENGDVFRPDQSLGMDANWILQFLMGTAPRPEETSQRLAKISDLIEDEQFDEAEKRIDELRDRLGDFPELVKLQTRVDRLRILGL